MELSDNHQPQSRRETMLTIMLTALAGGGFLLFLILVSGFFFFYVALVAGAIALLGVVHYYLWGEAMTHEVEDEKNQQELEGRVGEELENRQSHTRRF